MLFKLKKEKTGIKEELTIARATKKDTIKRKQYFSIHQWNHFLQMHSNLRLH